MFEQLPTIKTSTPDERLQALKNSRELLLSEPGESKSTIFGGGSKDSRRAPETFEMIRLAEYITTGHDYRDTHPQGKRRPIIQNVHVHAMGVPEELVKDLIPEGLLDHLRSHAEGREEEPADGEGPEDEDKKQPPFDQ